ncbi:MAG: DMT family transporter [Okeania sp. SIO3B5]|uniref:DMT family transporter n=1 Tax=Okeania sp. SIO3B5 TaxID=2607811 RepID=UPI0013FE6FFC|nr:DMT family transporter [Okeania sp. SIO3B5]NEO56063.1 DMT family transporter [Okeania sp. SIO3B5]
MDAPNKVSRLQLLSLPIDSVAALIASITCLSFSPIFIRLSELEIGPNATAFNRFWIAAIGFWLLNSFLNVPYQKQHTELRIQKTISIREIGLLIADGTLLSMGTICWTWSLTNTSVANSSIIHNLIPIFTILGGWLVFGKFFENRFILGTFVAIAGVMLLEVNDLFSLNIGQQLTGDFAALLSAVFFGVHPLIAEQLRTKFNAVTIMKWSSTASFLLVLPVVIFAQEQLFPSSITGWFSVISLAFVGQMLGIGLWTYCLKNLSSGFASLVGLLAPIFSSLEGWAIFSENIEPWTWVSFMVILFGMYLAISSKFAIKSQVIEEGRR